MSGLGVLVDHHWSVSCLASTTYLCWLCHSPSPDKDDYFVRLFTVALLPATIWVLFFSLSIPYGMHLMVPTHPCFFWVVCHPSRTFPPKEREHEPYNRFSPLFTAKPYPFTSDLWPNSFLPMLLGFFFLLGFPKWASTILYHGQFRWLKFWERRPTTRTTDIGLWRWRFAVDCQSVGFDGERIESNWMVWVGSWVGSWLE